MYKGLAPGKICELGLYSFSLYASLPSSGIQYPLSCLLLLSVPRKCLIQFIYTKAETLSVERALDRE